MVTLSAGEIGENDETVSITRYPQSVEADESARVQFRAESGIVSQSSDPNVEVRVFLFTGQEQIEILEEEDVGIARSGVKDNPAASLSTGGPNGDTTVTQGDTVEGTLSVSFDELEGDQARTDDFIILAGFDYYGADGYSTDNGFPDYRATSSVESISVQPVTRETRTVEVTDDALLDGADGGESRLRNAYANRPNFRILEIQFEDDARPKDLFGEQDQEVVNGIQTYKIHNLEYPNPSISVDSGGRFVKHEIIGGPVVRQKVGEEPMQFGIDGVCTETKAKQIDALKDARYGKLMTPRVPGGSIPVQFASASTDPISDGGGAKPAYGPGDTSELLYTYSINAVEIHRNIEQ